MEEGDRKHGPRDFWSAEDALRRSVYISLCWAQFSLVGLSRVGHLEARPRDLRGVIAAGAVRSFLITGRARFGSRLLLQEAFVSRFSLCRSFFYIHSVENNCLALGNITTEHVGVSARLSAGNSARSQVDDTATGQTIEAAVRRAPISDSPRRTGREWWEALDKRETQLEDFQASILSSYAK